MKWFFRAALPALALGGSAVVSGEQVKSIETFGNCTGNVGETDVPIIPPNRPDNIGVINIILPNSFGPSPVTGTVNARVSPQPIFNTSDISGNPEQGDKTRPFNVKMKETGFDETATSGFILVRVLIRNGSGWTFYENGGFHGVGTYEGAPAGLCGSYDVADPSQSDQYGPNLRNRGIATFYVDLSKWSPPGADGRQDLPFVIGLIPPGGADDSPIFIDPMIIKWS